MLSFYEVGWLTLGTTSTLEGWVIISYFLYYHLYSHFWFLYVIISYFWILLLYAENTFLRLLSLRKSGKYKGQDVTHFLGFKISSVPCQDQEVTMSYVLTTIQWLEEILQPSLSSVSEEQMCTGDLKGRKIGWKNRFQLLSVGRT